MQIDSDRRYTFPVDQDRFWTSASDVERYTRWWPWLRGFDANGLVTGDRWTCVVQPPLPYRLRFTITLDEVDPPHLATATIGGDVVGAAKLEVEPGPDGDGCRVRLSSSLSPGNPTLRAAASVARPVVRLGHDWVLDTGAQQFAARAF